MADAGLIGRFARPLSTAEFSRPASGIFLFWVAGLAILLFAAAWWLLSLDWHVQHPDLGFYQLVGEAFSRGQVPYRDFDPAYPPAALPILILPSILGAKAGIWESYALRFEHLTLVLGALLVLAVVVALGALRASRGRTLLAVSFVALSPLVVGSIMPARYDLWPAALTTIAVAAVIAGRDRIGSAVLGLAVMAKVYPVVILPLVLVYVWRRRGARAPLADAAFAAGGALIAALPFLVVAPAGLWRSLQDFMGRPLQVESLGAAVLWAANAVAGVAITVQNSYGSDNLVGTLPDTVAAIQFVALALVLATVWIVFARRPAASGQQLVAASAAAVCAFVLLGKVLSGQYLIWLVPLVALIDGRRGVLAAVTLGAALVLTQQWYPSSYPAWLAGNAPFVPWLVLTRDLMLAGLLAIVVMPRAGIERITRWFGTPARPTGPQSVPARADAGAAAMRPAYAELREVDQE